MFIESVRELNAAQNAFSPGQQIWSNARFYRKAREQLQVVYFSGISLAFFLMVPRLEVSAIGGVPQSFSNSDFVESLGRYGNHHCPRRAKHPYIFVRRERNRRLCERSSPPPILPLE